MSDPHRPKHRRHPNRLNRAHAGQSLDPTLTRKGLLAHPGSLLTAFAAILFFCYVFNVGNVQTFLDGFFGGLDSRVKSHNNEVSTFVIASLPYVGVGIAAVVVFFILMALGRGARTVSKRRKLSGREEVSLYEFIDAAEKHNISRKVAKQAYYQLLPHYEGQPRIQLGDRMGSSLHMNAVAISDLYGNLLRNTDRMRKVGDDGGKLVTVLDLITAVETSTKRSLTQSKLHLRLGHRGEGQAEAQAEETPVRKRPSLAHKVKDTVMRSMIRHRQPPTAQLPPVFVKPYRPPVKESELAAKPAPPKNESAASS